MVKCSVSVVKYFKIPLKQKYDSAIVIWLGKKRREQKKKVADLPTLCQIGDEIGNRTIIFLGL